MAAEHRRALPGDGRRRCCVLDLETAPDRHACVLARRAKGAPRGSPLHEVVNASLLRFTMAPDGSLSGFDLASFHRDEYREPDILIAVEDALAGVVDDGGLLGTFNGRGYDLPMIAVRQLRWWQCEADAIRRLAEGDGEHVDVMLELSAQGEARFPSLADACASVGFSLVGPSRPGSEHGPPKETEKCENDVIGTMILLLYVLASRQRSRAPLVRGLPALGNHIRAIAGGRPHLERFALSPLLGDDALAWGARTG